MKKLMFALVFVMLFAGLYAQGPQGISHQAVIRNAANELVTVQTIGIRISILQGSAEGTAVYVETHSPTSNANGLITYVIGQGINVSGTFAQIDWADGLYFLKTEADPGGGETYSITGTMQFYSVPYAFYAEKAGTLKDGADLGEMIYWDGYEWNVVRPGDNDQVFSWCNGVPTWGPCQEVFDVEFKLYMQHAQAFDPDTDVLYLTGSMFNWAEPGAQPERQALNRINNSMIWTINMTLYEGEYEYKYFMNNGWDAGEWTGEPNRIILVDEDMVVNDLWAGTEQPEQPVVTTSPATEITHNSASIGGEVIQDGIFEADERGVYWGTDFSLPGTENYTSLGSGSGEFSSAIFELEANTEYYFFAKAINQVGTSYGELLTFKTTSITPVVITGTATGITSFEASVGGHVLEQGISEITERGVYWGTNPDLLVNGAQLPAEGSELEYQIVLPDLLPGARYYYMAYATNQEGTDYGQVGFFNTPFSVPVVETHWAEDVGSNSVTLVGVLNSGGGLAVLSRGVYLSTQPNAHITGSQYTADQSSDNFEVSFTSLVPYTTYYFTAYATNTKGTGMGEEYSFVTEKTIPTVVSSFPSIIGSHTALIVGGVTESGGVEVTERGFFFGSEPDPAITGLQIIAGSDLGTYNSELTDLLPGTTYYFVAFATNSQGTAYSHDISFSTLTTIPVITSKPANGILPHSATIRGEITCDGGAEVIERGFFWGTDLSPQTNGTKTIAGNGTGNFNFNLTGLSQNATYYYVAYAENMEGIAVSAVQAFETPTFDGSPCPGPAHYISDIENNIYYTVQIGGRCWLRENLRTSSYSNGMPIGDARVWYNNNSAFKPTYGALYSWGAVNNSHGLCPTGWHVPSDAEWTQMLDYLMAEYGWSNFQNDPGGLGNKLKSCRQQGSLLPGGCNTTEHPYWFWTETHHFGTDHHGFSALPGGIQEANGVFQNMGTTGIFWSSTENDYTSAWYYGLGNNSGSVGRAESLKQTKLSVRCIKTASLPQINTTSAVNVTIDQATIGGVVIDENGSEVSERGVYYGTQTNPRLTGTKLSLGTGLGEFSTTLTDLSPYSTYYFVAYASSGEGTSYGEEHWFRTQSVLPRVRTDNMFEIGANQAEASGFLSTSGNTEIIDMGFCWSASADPSLPDDCISVAPASGSFTGMITGLVQNRKYYVRAYATNAAGTAYGLNRAFVTLPNVNTSEITIIRHNSAYGGGQPASGGNQPITAKGLCWGTSPNPTLTHQYSYEGSGTGQFTTQMTDLQPGTQYYVRAYATNVTGTGYGDQKIFTTLPILPTVNINEISLLTNTSVTVEGEVTDDGGNFVQDRGVVYSTSPYPTEADGIVWGQFGMGVYTVNITGLAPNTTYYIRPYAYNNAGIALGDQQTIRTLPYCPGAPTVTDVDGEVYNTVQIGNQCWMRENLRWLPEVHRPRNSSETKRRYYVAGYDGKIVEEAKATENYTLYGVLYNWKAAMDGESSSNNNPSGVQGACPPGWHLPSDAEWEELELFIKSPLNGFGGSVVPALKDTSDLWQEPSNHWFRKTNTSGFSALPGGYYVSIGVSSNWWHLGRGAIFATSTESEGNFNVLYLFGYELNRPSIAKDSGVSIRCIKD